MTLISKLEINGTRQVTYRAASLMNIDSNPKTRAEQIQGRTLEQTGLMEYAGCLQLCLSEHAVDAQRAVIRLSRAH